MKKTNRIIALLLVLSMVSSLSACKLHFNLHGKASSETSETTETTTTATTEATSSVITTAKETETSATAASVIDKTGIPEKGCKIEFKPVEDRYHYDMDLTLDKEEKTIGGHVDFTFFNDSDADWDKLCLRDYPSLFKDPKTAGYDAGVWTNGEITDISNIKDGRNGASIDMSRDEDVSVVWLPLATPLAPGEKMTLSYDFVATVPTLADRYGVQNGVFNVTNFYPILAEYTKDGWSHEKYYDCGECFYSEISDYDVRLTVPENMVVLSTGLEQGETQNDGSKTITIHADCVRDFVFCGSEEFKTVEGDYKDTHIRVAYTEENKALTYKTLAEGCLVASVNSLRVFGEAFGEYPYKDLEVILAPIAAGGMEYPNLIIITKDIGAGSDINNVINTIGATIVSHEIGHQWFMGIVGSNSGMEPWLDESFASYTEYVYDYGVNHHRSYIDPSVILGDAYIDDEWIRNNKSVDYIPINRPFYDFNYEGSFITAAYSLGKDALIAMDSCLEEGEFYGIIRAYVQKCAFKNATQKDFFDTLYQYAGTDNKALNKVINSYFDESVQPPAA